MVLAGISINATVATRESGIYVVRMPELAMKGSSTAGSTIRVESEPRTNTIAENASKRYLYRKHASKPEKRSIA